MYKTSTINKSKFLILSLLLIFYFSGCSEENTDEPAIFDASGVWTFAFTQTKKLDGDYIECGTDPVPQKSFLIAQSGNDVTLIDKNGEEVIGSVSGATYEFEFREMENDYDEDYIDFKLKIKLSSETNCTGTYRMDERTFFSDYNMSFFCITEGTLEGTCPYDPKKNIERGTVKDVDGNIYKTVKIGEQWWMSENLKVTRYRNGDAVVKVTDNSEWASLNSGAFCSYNNDDNNINTYGLLYNWFAVNDSRGLAPQGWHIPSQAEWQELIDLLGGFSVAGGKMKEEGTIHWNAPNAGATNEWGFNGLPAGERYFNGTFYGLGFLTRFYSSTEGSNNRALGRYLYSDGASIGNLILSFNYGFSIRCVKD